MFKKFLPKQEKFFDFLADLSVDILEAGKLLNEMLINHHRHLEYASKIHLLENKCDDLTPIDREDIYELANSLDNIIDAMDAIATRYSIYKIVNPIPFGPQLSEILLLQVQTLVEVIKELHNYDNAFDKLVLIRNLETEGDSVFRDSMTDLFENEKDVIELIKKKEILENIERAVDKCQTATIVIEGILIKNI
jgi:hypothetical protein